MTRVGAILGMITGAATVVLWKNFANSGLYEIVPGFLVASVVIIIASLFTNVRSGTKAAYEKMLKSFENKSLFKAFGLKNLSVGPL